MPSGIPFPHRVDLRRATDSGQRDAWENEMKGDPETVATLPAWVQTKSAREMEAWSHAGGEVSTHTIFVDPYGLQTGDVLVTLAGGGQLAGDWHRVLGVRNPDGGTDHLEVDTVKVGAPRG